MIDIPKAPRSFVKVFALLVLSTVDKSQNDWAVKAGQSSKMKRVALCNGDAVRKGLVRAADRPKSRFPVFLEVATDHYLVSGMVDKVRTFVHDIA